MRVLKDREKETLSSTKSHLNKINKMQTEKLINNRMTIKTSFSQKSTLLTICANKNRLVGT
jgi:hypothetical protein